MKAEDKKKLIEDLTNQHKELHECASLVLELSKTSDVKKASQVSSHLKRFSGYLSNHLMVENTIFYPELLRDMDLKGQDTSKTKKFISEMDDIGEVIYSFLDKYENENSITVGISKFNNEFSEIKEILKLRTETEEEGVFTYWEVI